jgi:mRNA interferase MazF
LNTNPPFPRRGEVWLVNFDPTVGAEIKKTRPAVVISSDAIGKLPVKLIAPITDWKEHYSRNIWHIRIDPHSSNSLISDLILSKLANTYKKDTDTFLFLSCPIV